jgi:hypothetical protein
VRQVISILRFCFCLPYNSRDRPIRVIYADERSSKPKWLCNEVRTDFNGDTVDLLIRYLNEPREKGIMTVYEAYAMLEGLRVDGLKQENYFIDELIQYLVDDLATREEHRGLREEILKLKGERYWFINRSKS